MICNPVYFLIISLLLISCDFSNKKDYNTREKLEFIEINLCNENKVWLPENLGFKPLEVTFHNDCIYTAVDSNRIQMMIYYGVDTIEKTFDSFIKKQQISNKSLYGNIIFSEVKSNFFQNRETFSYSAKSAIKDDSAEYFFMTTFYYIIDLSKKEYLTFHFITYNSNIKFMDILIEKAEMTLNSFSLTKGNVPNGAFEKNEK